MLRHIPLALVAALAVSCTFGSVRKVVDLNEGGFGVATNFEYTAMFVGTVGTYRLEAYDPEDGTFLGGHSLSPDHEIKALTQDPENQRNVLALHENGAIVSWSPEMDWTVVARLPDAATRFQNLDFDAGTDGRIYVAFGLDGGAWLAMWDGARWTPHLIEDSVPIGVPKVAVDDERGEVLLMHNSLPVQWTRLTRDLQVLGTANAWWYPGPYPTAFDIDVLDGIAVLSGLGQVWMVSSDTGDLHDVVENLDQSADQVQFAADPSTVTFHAIVRGLDWSTPWASVKAISVEP